VFGFCRRSFPSGKLRELGEKDDGGTAGVIFVVNDILSIVRRGLAGGTGFTEAEEAAWQKVN